MGVLDVVRFLLFFPVFVQLMDFDGDVSLFFQTEGLGTTKPAELRWYSVCRVYLMHFAETAFADQTEE